MPDEDEITDNIDEILRAFAEEDICQCNCGCEKDAETTDGRDTPLCMRCYREC